MTQFLPDNLLKLFAPRPPIPYLPPPDELTVDKKRPKYQGLAEFLNQFESETKPPPPKPHIETKEEKRERWRKEKQELLAYKIEQQIAMWNPADNENATTDPYRTLFVARLNYETTESKLRREFEAYGKIKKIVIPKDKDGKPRGYCFIEYSHKSEMSQAYKRADGIKIDGRRVVVDYERGRTNKAWLPRRLGGGKGDTRKAREPRHISEAREAERYGNDSYEYRERSTHSRERSSRRHDSRDREDRSDRNGGSDRHRERNGSSDRYRDRDDRRRRD
uniref:U1 small nuclear ribonucleoprotein 70 kDa n=1 Tax=Panagrolaimus sp. PS1159 TaxID=55785 RepID=A0AC35GT13_9BILA